MGERRGLPSPPQSPYHPTATLPPVRNRVSFCNWLGIVYGWSRTYCLDLLSSHRLVALQSTSNLKDLATVNQAVARRNHTRASQFVGRQQVELRLGNGLGQNVLGDTRLSNALDSLNSLLSTLANSSRRSRNLDREQAGVGVCQVLGHNGGARGGSGGLRQQGEARRPLDVGLAAKEGRQDGKVGLVGGEVETGESEDQSIGASERRALLAAVVLGGLGEELERACRRGGDVLEERLDPLRQVCLGGAIGNDSDIGLGVNSRGKVGNRVLAEVGAERGRARRVNRGTETLVEGDGVGVIESLRQGVVGEFALLQLQNVCNLLVELVRYLHMSAHVASSLC